MTLEERIAQLEERIHKLESEMFAQGFWQRPEPLPRVFSTVEAEDLTFFNDPDGTTVTLTFGYKCGVAGCQAEMKHEYLLVPASAVNRSEPYSKLMPCSQDDSHRTKVVFKRK